jgi:hypothetical protein
MTDILYDWDTEDMLEVFLKEPDDFLKVKETLTRIGVASKRDYKLYQTAHILHKRGRYFIVHFKELFMLDGKQSDLTVSDIDRRDAIGCLLEDWKLLSLKDRPKVDVRSALSILKVVSHKDKKDWELIPKYNIGHCRIPYLGSR